MPYDYEALKNHVSAAHPELLDAFVEGWNNLGPQSQSHWRQQAFLTPKNKVTYKCWLSWTTVQTNLLFGRRKDDFPFDFPLSNFEKELAILFHNKMQHVGQLFDLPYMPPVENKGAHRSSSERHTIAKDAAKFVIHTELRKVLKKWKKDVDEHGLEALRKVYLTAPQFEDDEKNERFDSDWGCDSASDLSDSD